MDLSHLNPPQRAAVLTTEGPLLVLAGAGSGKTRVITHRIVHLLEKKVPARAILAVTFTNKAAPEMKERVVEMGGQRALGTTLSTFHAFGAEVLREHLSKLGYPKKFAIVDTGDQLALIRRAMKERQIDDKTFDARKVLTIISRAKSSGLEPPAEARSRRAGRRHRARRPPRLSRSTSSPSRPRARWTSTISSCCPSQVFERWPEVRETYTAALPLRHGRRVPGHQPRPARSAASTSASTHLNVCVVGDDDQCIYSWRGAEVRNILEFEQHFPGGKEVRLEQNYRSTEIILDAANAVIEKNPERRAKRMWTSTKGGALGQRRRRAHRGGRGPLRRRRDPAGRGLGHARPTRLPCSTGSTASRAWSRSSCANGRSATRSSAARSSSTAAR